MMIQKKIKKWYPTKERENEDKRLVRALEAWRQYGNMGVGYTTTESGPQQESVKPNTWQKFKEDFGEWKWSSFWCKLIIFSVLSLVFSISHRLIIGPIKLNNGNPSPFYLEVLCAQGLYLGTASLLWVLEKLWYIKSYITAFIKLGITFILILPLALVLSFLPMNYKETKSISEKITDFWGDKCFTKKEGEIIDKYIKEL